MANNQFVGKMSFVVDAQTSGLAATMAGAGQSVENFGNKATQVNAKVASNSKQVAKFGNQVQQFGFLVDDAFAGFTARGFSGMIQAAANNATMLAMQFGSIAGLTTVLVMGVAQLVTKMWKTVDPAKALTRELERQKVAHDANIEALKTVFEMQQSEREHREFVADRPDVGAIDDRIKQLKKNQREEKHAMQAHGADLADINAEIRKRLQFEIKLGPQWDWKPEEGKQLGKRKFKRFVKKELTEEEKEVRARARLLEEGNSQREEFQKALDDREKKLAEMKATAERSALLQRQIDSLMGSRTKAFNREHKEKMDDKAEEDKKKSEALFKQLRQQRDAFNKESDRNVKETLDARQMMLESGRNAQLVNDNQGGLELEITANTDEFDAQLETSFFKFRRMMLEADEIPDDAARGMKLHAILAAADREMTDLAEKAGQVNVDLGSMRSVGASEAGSTQAFSLMNRAINSNRQDQENISSEVRGVAAKVVETNRKLDALKSLFHVVR